jgi:hypothetical protein
MLDGIIIESLKRFIGESGFFTEIMRKAHPLYDYKSPYEERRPWNDATLVPKAVNGKKDDLRRKTMGLELPTKQVTHI